MEWLADLARTFVFPRQLVVPYPDPCRGLSDLTTLWLETDEGPVEAWLLRCQTVSEADPRPVAIFAHGNGELIEQWPQLLEGYRRLGLHLCLAEYRGYGRSAGKPSERKITEDLMALRARLCERPDVDASRLVYHGRSIGGGAVCALARRHPPAALILQSTFTSLPDVTRNLGLPAWSVPDRFDNLSTLATTRCPVLVLHGTHDRLIPFSHAQRLYEAALGGHARDARLRSFDVDHNTPIEDPAYWQILAAFLRDAGVLGPAST